jgi:hypothetical protein
MLVLCVTLVLFVVSLINESLLTLFALFVLENKNICCDDTESRDDLLLGAYSDRVIIKLSLLPLDRNPNLTLLVGTDPTSMIGGFCVNNGDPTGDTSAD